MSAEEIEIYFGIFALLVVGGWAAYRHFSGKPGEPENKQKIDHGDENIQIGQVGGDVTIKKGAEVDVNAIVARLEESARREGSLTTQLEESQQRVDGLGKQLSEAVQALADQREAPDAPAEIDEALALLAKGDTGKAEAVFESIKVRRKAEGAEAFTEAAAAARHIGALAFLNNTGKALDAYREAVDLDPENADGWNQLGLLLDRTGDLDDAEQAYLRVLSLGNQMDDQVLLAVATSNLGLIYKTRGDLDRAEAMHEKGLKIFEDLGRKDGMAINYNNLGLLYQARSDLDRAEAMYEKSLEINVALRCKERMASDYSNFGLLYNARGDLDRAEAMYEKGLMIFGAIGRKDGMAIITATSVASTRPVVNSTAQWRCMRRAWLSRRLSDARQAWRATTAISATSTRPVATSAVPRRCMRRASRCFARWALPLRSKKWKNC